MQVRLAWMVLQGDDWHEVRSYLLGKLADSKLQPVSALDYFRHSLNDSLEIPLKNYCSFYLAVQPVAQDSVVEHFGVQPWKGHRDAAHHDVAHYYYVVPHYDLAFPSPANLGSPLVGPRLALYYS